MKHRFTSFALVLTLLGTVAFGATRTQAASNVGGAAGLVAAIVQVAVDDADVDVELIEVDLDNVLNNSLNNLRALNNILNNSPILSNNNITVEDIDILEDIDVDVDVDIDDVVAVLNILGEDFIVLTR